MKFKDVNLSRADGERVLISVVSRRVIERVSRMDEVLNRMSKRVLFAEQRRR